MYRKIVLAYDPRGLAESAVPIVRALARQSGAEVIVVSVHDRFWEMVPAEDLRNRLDALTNQMRAAGVRARAELLTIYRDHASTQLLQAVRLLEPDLVALGSHGHGDLASLFAGSTGHELTTGLDCPVIIAHGGREQPDGVQPIRRILVAIDRSEESDAAVAAAATLAAEHNAAVTVLHVLETETARVGTAYAEDEESARPLLEAAEHRLVGSASVTTQALRGLGSPAALITEHARDVGADLIILGSRRLTSLAGLRKGSVSHEVISATDRPVLLAGRRPADHPAEE